MKIISESASVGLTDSALAIQHFGSDALRAEHLPKLTLLYATRFHQVMKNFQWSGFGRLIKSLLKIFDQPDQ